MIEETSAGIVLFRKEGSKILFLLLHYPSGHWDFVKGKMEDGESTHETAIREAREETGITDITFLENFDFGDVKKNTRIVENDTGDFAFQSQINYGVTQCKTEYFTFLESLFP